MTTQTIKASKLLGPEPSKDLIKWAGGKISSNDDYSALVICNQDGFNFPEDVDSTISSVRKLRAGEDVKLVLPNPDLIYPSKTGFGITSGSIANIIENALKIILGSKAPKFEMLGKPYAPIFNKATENLSGKTCMIGDQFETDVWGANLAGIDSILVETGICNRKNAGEMPEEKRPQFILKNFKL